MKKTAFSEEDAVLESNGEVIRPDSRAASAG